ncbi:hypothetical protein D3C80_1909460 [compost metagenome]
MAFSLMALILLLFSSSLAAAAAEEEVELDEAAPPLELPFAPLVESEGEDELFNEDDDDRDDDVAYEFESNNPACATASLMAVIPSL